MIVAPSETVAVHNSLGTPLPLTIAADGGITPSSTTTGRPAYASVCTARKPPPAPPAPLTQRFTRLESTPLFASPSWCCGAAAPAFPSSSLVDEEEVGWGDD